MVQLTSIPPELLGPIDPAVLSPPMVMGSIGEFLSSISSQLGAILPGLLGALAFLIGGWLLAIIAASAVRGLLGRTDWDDRLWKMVFGDDADNPPKTEAWAGTVVFWLILFFAVLAAFDTLGLESVSNPLNNMLSEVANYVPKLASAAGLALLAWFVATGSKLILVRLLEPFKLDDKLAKQADGEGSPPVPVSETFATVLYWFVWLFFLPVILDVLQLEGPLGPVQDLLDSILSAIPNILTAAAVGLVGWFVARIVRGLVTSLLKSLGTDSIGAKMGISNTGTPLSDLLGSAIFILVLIPTAIAALSELKIDAISDPAINMLNTFMSFLPQVFTATLILIAFFIIGRYAAEFISGFLSGAGFDGLAADLGVSSLLSLPEGDASEGEDSSSAKTPSEIAGIVTLVVVVLIGAIAATEVLALAALNEVVTQLIVLGGRVLVAGVIFGGGVYLANLSAGLIASTGNTAQVRLFSIAARVSILALVGAMALQVMGIATEIVVLAFGLIFGGLTVAFAIAFGLGGRQVASNQLQEWFDNRHTPQ